MRTQLIKLLGCLTVACIVAPWSIARAQPPAGLPTSNVPSAGILLLKNNQIIDGQIEFSVDHYIVRMPDQEMQIRAADVEFFCRDMEDGYQHKKSVVQPNSVDEHLRLAQWCERHKLFAHAAEELTAAKQIEPKHPMIGVIERQLAVDLELTKEAPARPLAAIKMPSDEVLDQMIRGMPVGAVAQYVNVVQPILLNLCPGAAGSMPGLSPTGHLQLLRPPYGESPNRRITQRNLFAVLQYVNWDDPGASSLLTGIMAPDGAKSSVFLTRHSTQYQRVEEWVYGMTGKPLPGAGDTPLQPEGDARNIQDMAQQVSIAKRARQRNVVRTAHTTDEGDVDPILENAADKNAAATKGNLSDKNTAVDKTMPRSNNKSAAGNLSNKDGAPGLLPATDARTAAQAAASVGDPFDPGEFNSQADANGAGQPLLTPAAKMLGNH